jgi:hypothetical protein
VLGTILAGALVAAPTGGAEDAGGLIGMGVRSCDDLGLAEVSAGRGDDQGVLTLRRYDDWAAGFVSGLSLAAGRDLLRNVPFGGLMRRVGAHCADHPRDDVLTAISAVLKDLNAPEPE